MKNSKKIAVASLSFILALPTFTSLANSSNVAVTGSNTIKLDEKTENEELKSDIGHMEYKSEKNSDHKINNKEEKSQENKNADKLDSELKENLSIKEESNLNNDVNAKSNLEERTKL
ncbi:hypothetical protein FYJ26_02175 [Anaerococcus sp. WCA-380-WT-2B]|uniref:N-acetylmuramoyl-L-alanine amidase n=1 Tax=Anaerococcus porci TaxID=2652269 RepID=A0A6N7VCU8_9FIRM|nr:hypothetical protein [Anaerococcus porci]MSS77235.1 hypothetical protein [Anaerococcus porci]